ncbi:MAG: HD domain-containing protein [Firmicutes bacterium]|nr:HD domain-containing protein [Bacillota bacterium]
MKLNLTDMLFSLSEALDIVEHEMTGVQSDHGKHVAYMTALMGIAAGFEGEELSDLACVAMLHDNAFTEYAREEFSAGNVVDVYELKKRADLLNGDDYICFISGSRHSAAGERNIALIPFGTDVKNVILYHHENADGTGPFKKTAAETNFKSQIVHLADTIDVIWNINTLTEREFEGMYEKICSLSGKMFSKESVELFKKGIKFEDFLRFQQYGAEKLLRDMTGVGEKDYTDEQIHDIAVFFAGIVDCKSSFTRTHCIGAAEKADVMTKFYGFDADKSIRFYLSAALHDIGKLIIQNDILEKRGKLDDNEFANIKTHAAATYEILSKIEGFEDITRWASNHHEKLNGRGYPRGLSADELTLEDRLMACLDIYQALTEPRPYKAPISHKKAIEIMEEMADNNEIDKNIVADIDKCFG